MGKHPFLFSVRDAKQPGQCIASCQASHYDGIEPGTLSWHGELRSVMDMVEQASAQYGSVSDDWQDKVTQ
jgi:hypothetical protein